MRYSIVDYKVSPAPSRGRTRMAHFARIVETENEHFGLFSHEQPGPEGRKGDYAG